MSDAARESEAPDPSEHELTREQAVEQLSKALGDRCRAIYAIGSEFARGPRSGRGRLLILVESLDPDTLETIVELVTKCQASRLKVRVDTASNIICGTDTFPAFALEIKDHRTLLWGKDELDDLQIDRSHMRLDVEHGLRGMQRELVANYLDRDIKGWQVPALRRMSRKLVFLMEGLLLCTGNEVPQPATPSALLDAVRTKLLPDAEPEIWNTLQAFARNELPPGRDGAARVYACLFAALPQIIDVVDKLGDG